MMDRSITYGGTLPDEGADEGALLLDMLATLRIEAELRGWRGAGIVELRKTGRHRQIEIVPTDRWMLAIEDLRLIEGKGRRDAP